MEFAKYYIDCITLQNKCLEFVVNYRFQHRIFVSRVVAISAKKYKTNHMKIEIFCQIFNY